MPNQEMEKLIFIGNITNKMSETSFDKADPLNTVQADEPKADEAKVDEAKADEAKVDEAKADEPKADETKADEPKADETKAVESHCVIGSKSDEAVQADEPKADEVVQDDDIEAESETDETVESQFVIGSKSEKIISKHAIISFSRAVGAKSISECAIATIQTLLSKKISNFTDKMVSLYGFTDKRFISQEMIVDCLERDGIYMLL